MTEPIGPDPIVEEIHRTRREIAERFGGDLRAILDDARERQAKSGRAIWQPKPGTSSSSATEAKPKSP